MANAPTYSVAYTDTKIPVSKHTGKMWKGRRDAAKRHRADRIEKAWSEAIDYYNHDQSTTKADRMAGYDNVSSAGRTMASSKFDEVENLVYANVNAIVPRVYMKNPKCEITPNVQQDEQLVALAKVSERLVNALAAKRSAPGFNYKNKAKRCVVMAELTNRAWIEVDYVKKSESSEQTFDEMQKISQQLAKAKSGKEIEEAEGKLMALEDKISLLTPSGPTVRFRSPFDVLVDPDSEEDDGTDAKWMMTKEFVPTSWLNATYGVRKGKEVKSMYESTHVLAPGGDEDSANTLSNNFTLLGEDKTYQDYGYESQEEFDAAKRTMIWKVWDRTTRRLLLFHDKDWTMPIWVWDDPLQLDQFFPLAPLTIYTSPTPGECKGEVSYYLDQQDAVNEMNQEEKMARQWVRRHVIFNSNVLKQSDAEKILKGADATAIGLNLPPDADLNKALSSLKPPSMNFPELFNKESKLQAIDRISKVNNILRGGEFKTNTTNVAISEYNSVQGGSLDEHIDQVEDHTGQVFWMVLQLLMMNMSQEEVAQVVGQQDAAVWRNMTPEEIRASFSVRIVGGSSIKPTSQAKQKQAMELGQILGQFVSASPIAFVVAVRAFERAFDEVVVTEEDWAMIRQGAEAQMQAQLAQAQPQQAQGNNASNGASGDEVMQVAQLIDSMPPEAKEALARAIVGGAPIMDAVQEIVATLNGGTENARQ